MLIEVTASINFCKRLFFKDLILPFSGHPIYSSPIWYTYKIEYVCRLDEIHLSDKCNRHAESVESLESITLCFLLILFCGGSRRVV